MGSEPSGIARRAASVEETLDRRRTALSVVDPTRVGDARSWVPRTTPALILFMVRHALAVRLAPWLDPRRP